MTEPGAPPQPLRRLLLGGALLLSAVLAGVVAVVVATQAHIADLARDARDNVLPVIFERNELSRDVERLILFGAEVHNAADPGRRRQARLAAQMLVYNEKSFRSDAKARELGGEAIRTLAALADQRDRQDALGVAALQVLLDTSAALDAARLRPEPAARLRDLLVRAGNAGSETALGETEAAVDAAVPARVAAGLRQLVALRRQIVDIDRRSAEAWDGLARRLKGLTDTLAAQAQLETSGRFSTIQGQAGRVSWVAVGGLGLLSLLLFALAWAGHRLIVRPLTAATGLLERTLGGQEQETGPLPPSAIAEVGSIVHAARALVENMHALAEERHKVAQVRLEAAAARERDLQVLVAERTRELEQAMERAEAANKAKSAFLANMSHELRTPLNAVLGFSRLMLDARISTEDRQRLEIINRSGEHLLQLINDILDMSKVEAGRATLNVQAFDLHTLAGDVVAMVGARAREAGLELSLDVASGTPRYVQGDHVKLRQVLINLLGNAIKYTDEGGIVLRLGTAQPAADGRPRIACEVEDTGIGIADAELARIFEPFEQVATTGPSKGTGLGLAIARQFAELMGGGLTVQSRVGHGSVFRLEVPCALAAAADLADAPKASPKVVGLAPDQPACRLLVVDDNRENRLLLRSQLEGLGFQVREAEDGAAAVTAFTAWQPELIWMDRRMPVLDGLEATRRIRKLPAGHTVVIIALTASAFEDSDAELAAAGCDDVLRKPYRFEDLLAAMARHLGVRYRYAGAMPDTGSDRAMGGDSAVHALPEDLVAQLREAVSVCSYRRANELAAAAVAHDEAAAQRIAAWVARFEWQALADFLEHRANPADAVARTGTA